MTPSRRTTGLAVAAALVVVGCGRSQLALPGASVAGGAASSSAGGSGGGAVVACATLNQVEPVVGLAPSFSGGDADELRLVPLRGDGGEVATVFLVVVPGGQLVLHHAAFAPWASWPASGSLAPVHATFEIAVSTLHAAPSATPHHYAAAYGRPGGLVAFLEDVDPHVDGTGASQSLSITGSDAELLVARPAELAAPTHLACTYADGTVLATPVPPATELPPVALGCAAVQPASAGAVAWTDRWLAAVSTGAPVGACPTPAPTVPDHIDVLEISKDPSALLRASISTGIVVSVAAAPHPDGAYIVWTDHGAGASTLHAARFVGSPPGIAAKVDLTPPDDSGSSFVVGATGRRLAVAHRGAPGTIAVSIYDESLTLLAEASVEAGGFSGPTSLLGAPDGRGVVVAWTAVETHPWHGAMARLDCGP